MKTEQLKREESDGQSRRLHYGWLVVVVTFLAIIVTAGIRSTPGVLIVPLEHDFGWDRAGISGAIAINLFLYGLSGPFVAAFMERFGIRRLMVTSLCMLAAGTGLTSLISQIWQFAFLWGVIIGLGSGGILTVLGTMVANRWFVKRRGVVIGLMTAGGATGQLVFLPLLAYLVTKAGWQTAVWTVAGASMLLIPVVWLLMRERPSDLGLAPYGGTMETETPRQTGNPVAAAWRGLREGIGSSNFWLLAGSFFICGLTTSGLISTHLIPASMEHGMPEVMAASLLATIGVFDMIGTMVSGWLSDRYNNRWLLFWYYGLRGLALLGLPYALEEAHYGLGLFIVFYGLDWVATVPPTVRLTTDVFGKEKAGIMYGWIFSSHQVGAAAAAYGGGVMHTWLGNYEATFVAAGFFCMAASALVLRIRRPQAMRYVHSQ
ncbi:MFS transporter [Brevibacillus sp. SYP-B805]|uniref:MFS transporter n=1 Tax=Brevibacillus sp. SYP-B805 TaxID=1578199 RepID=UPI0013EBAF0F|nr:MFS transporter [Brevibacillus sp. SYP-B805]NGQ93788.1 MFS transporter [Brevibacillus sp. SYP-B805]